MRKLKEFIVIKMKKMRNKAHLENSIKKWAWFKGRWHNPINENMLDKTYDFQSTRMIINRIDFNIIIFTCHLKIEITKIRIKWTDIISNQNRDENRNKSRREIMYNQSTSTEKSLVSVGYKAAARCWINLFSTQNCPNSLTLEYKNSMKSITIDEWDSTSLLSFESFIFWKKNKLMNDSIEIYRDMIDG